MESIKALEFFSGIGGLHFGFNASGVEGKVLESFDMNQQANEAYKLSFKKPPVSPYTRGGKLLDDQDNRAKPLLRLLDQLENMATPPTYIFLENVKNFEESRSREMMIRVLRAKGYVFRECLLTPYHFGIPNDRLRYFLMARLRSSFPQVPSTSDKDPVKQQTQQEDDVKAEKEEREEKEDREEKEEKEQEAKEDKEDSGSQGIFYTAWPFPGFVDDPTLKVEQHPFQIPTLNHFLDSEQDQQKNSVDYLLSRQLILNRPNFRFDVLQPTSTRSSCFTKSYGSHHIASGGGLLQTQNMDQTTYDFTDSESIAALGLRFLTPTEVARLHAFPLSEDRPWPSNGTAAASSASAPILDLEVNAETESSSDKEVSDGTKPEKAMPATISTTVREFSPQLLTASMANGKQAQQGPFLRFPNQLKSIQRYKLLGNSLNVWVVAELLRGVLFANHPGVPLPEESAGEEGSLVGKKRRRSDSN
ncbi:tRNA (cytosine-5-)-methyltransferase [Lunasporangiospora selenospora]|uniref:tRNA (cytosine(38)-C(5))-methyltransferase n=1 Tax=Lunasporangiospora selenospora TaxID=979761 RepID=A0A9P6KCI3_9FUNG|nr:tRNA (cytosine-5-)-methyltransferase [Lunasporangiospora selenospora]